MMRPLKLRPLLTTLFAIGLAGAVLPGYAQTPADPAGPGTAAPKAEPSAPKKKAKSEDGTKKHEMPFRGTIESVNQVEKTITVKGKDKEHVLQITSQSKLSKEGKPATLADAVVGENLAGFARETAAGKIEVVSVRFNTKAPGQSKPKKAKAAKEAQPDGPKPPE